MQHLLNIFEVFTNVFAILYKLIVEWIGITMESGLSPSIPLIIFHLIVILVVLGSGFAAATVAEMRLRARPLHLALGFLLPVAYPVAIYFVLPKKKIVSPDDGFFVDEDEEELEEGGETKLRIAKPGAKSQQIVHDRSEEEAPPEATVRQAPPSDEDVNDAETIKIKVDVPEGGTGILIPDKPPAPSGNMNQQYFTSIAVDDAGNDQGPFMLELEDGRFLEAMRIVECKPNMVVLEIPGETGEPRTIRVPYARIIDCKLSSEWMD